MEVAEGGVVGSYGGVCVLHDVGAVRAGACAVSRL